MSAMTLTLTTLSTSLRSTFTLHHLQTLLRLLTALARATLRGKLKFKMKSIPCAILRSRDDVLEVGKSKETIVHMLMVLALGHSLYRDWDTSEGPIDTTRYIWQDEATRIRELTSNPWSGFEDPPPPMGYVQAPPLNPWGPYEGRMIPCVELSRKRSSMAMEGQANNIKRTRFEASTPRQSSSPFGRRFQLDGPGTGPFSPTPFTSDPFASAPRPSNRGSSHHRSNPGRATGQVIPRGRPNLADYPYERRHTGTRGHIAGYPRREDRMPPNLSSEDVIKHYPNHLQGDVLLGIAENWAPTEIERYFGKPDVLKSNTLVKRINAEKMKRGLLPPRPPVQRAPRPRRRE